MPTIAPEEPPVQPAIMTEPPAPQQLLSEPINEKPALVESATSNTFGIVVSIVLFIIIAGVALFVMVHHHSTLVNKKAMEQISSPQKETKNQESSQQAEQNIPPAQPK